MVKLITTIACLISLAATQVNAQDAATKSFDGESEASVVIIDGLSKSETYGGKTKNNYKLTDTDIMTIFGKYIKTSTQLTGAASKSETARNWEAGLRYEKVFTADVLMDILSAPFSNKILTSSIVLIPPPTVKGMLICVAISLTSFASVFLFSVVAVMSRNTSSSAPSSQYLTASSTGSPASRN